MRHVDLSETAAAHPRSKLQIIAFQKKCRIKYNDHMNIMRIVLLF